MLALTRRVGERLFVGENIVITMLESDRGKFRIGIEAPRSVSVEREEIAEPGKYVEIYRKIKEADGEPK